MKLYRDKGFYEKYVKRFLDIVFSLLFIVLFFWLYFLIALIVIIKMGRPVLFRQPRPGMVRNGRESIFDMLKFRTMTNEKDETGRLLPDEKRLPAFGAFLRSTSLDELPEFFCILKGDMSIVGPRPQLVRDMVFMSEKQRMRHTAKPGLTGLAQVKGRNAISWEEKMRLDIVYVNHITFLSDLKILFETVFSVFRREGITDGQNATAMDYGDTLLKEGKITKETYNRLNNYAVRIITNYKGKK